jgi:hypothetical protein
LRVNNPVYSTTAQGASPPLLGPDIWLSVSSKQAASADDELRDLLIDAEATLEAPVGDLPGVVFAKMPGVRPR